MKATRKKLIAIAVAVVTLAVLSAVYMATRGPGHRINMGTVLQVKKGMTSSEVESLFGVPPGDYVTQPTKYLGPPPPNFRPMVYENESAIWASDDARATIRFDKNSRVEEMFISYRVKVTLLERIRGKLGL